MALKISGADAIAACNILTSNIDEGSANPNPVIEIYDGTAPASITDAVTTQVKLVELPLDETEAFQGATDEGTHAEAVANAVPDTPALADGTASWFRVKDKDGTVRWQGDITEANLGGDLELSSVNIIEGVNVVTVSLTARMPKG